MDGYWSHREIARNRQVEQLRHTLGAHIGGLLAEDGLTDLYLNPPKVAGEPGTLWVERFGREPEAVGTMTAAEAQAIIMAAAGMLDTVVTGDRAFLEGELYGDGPRIEALIPPVVLGPAFAIRIPSTQVWTLADYEARENLTAAQRQLLEAAAHDRRNVVFVGETGSGKTSLLNAFGAAVAEARPHDRIVLIEGTREGRLRSANIVPIRTTAHFPEQVALRAALRLNPKRIWMGEVRGAEFLDMLMCWNTGHRGGACSLHSDTATPEDALLRMEQMAALVTQAPQQRVIARTIDLIVCLKRDTNGRRWVSQIVAVQGWDGHRYQTHVEA